MDSRQTERALRGAILVFLALLIALPVVTDAAPRKVTKELVDQLFQSPATPEDTALARSVKERLQAMGAQSTKTTATASMGSKVFWWDQVTVDARSGHVRLSGASLTPEQRAAAESVVRATPGVGSWDWGASRGRPRKDAGGHTVTPPTSR